MPRFSNLNAHAAAQPVERAIWRADEIRRDLELAHARLTYGELEHAAEALALAISASERLASILRGTLALVRAATVSA